MQDKFYQDKLLNLAESYKKQNLDFSNIEEEEGESEYQKTDMGFSMTPKDEYQDSLRTPEKNTSYPNQVLNFFK